MGENGRGLQALLAVVSCGLAVLGCGGASRANLGDETGDCYPNHTCNGDLTCLSDLCVRVTVDAGTGTGTNGSGGSGGTMTARDAATDVGRDGGSVTNFQPAPHPRMPQAANLGGPILDAPKVQPIFYVTDGDQTAIGAFLTALASSAYWPATTVEYGVGPLQILPPLVLATTPPMAINDADLQGQLVANTASAAAPWGAADPQTIYLFVLPQGTNAVIANGGTCCQDFGGYHYEFRSNSGAEVPYAVGCSCPGLLGPNLTALQERTVAISHELVEASTDPLPRTDPAYQQQDFAHYVWTFLTGGELADLCALNPDAAYRLPGTSYSVQRSWSNAAAARGDNPCVPAPAIGPYVNAVAALEPIMFGGVNGFPTQGLTIPLGSSRTVPVTLYSTGPTASWTITAYTYEDVRGGDRSSLGVALDKSEGVNGDVIHLTLTPRAANQAFGGEAFILLSQYGHPGDGDYQTNLSVGLIGN